MSKTKPKPCPFCGFVPKGALLDDRPVALRERITGIIVVCPQCLAKGPRGDGVKEAIDAWNRRVE
jgi:hypothetical protein